MPESLKLITLNIEGNRHLDKQIAWLKQEKPDVLCLQELFAVDASVFAEELGLEPHFVPLSRVENENKYNIPTRGLWGLGIFSALKTTSVQSYHYYGDDAEVPLFTDPNSGNRALLAATVKKGRTAFNIATTHFTWSDQGEATEDQRRDLGRLMQLVSNFDELALCGDFNAPRGREIYSILAQTLEDQLPEKITTTIDPDMHYAGALELVVDSIFTTPGYKMTRVHTKSGISDHQAVIGHLKKA